MAGVYVDNDVSAYSGAARPQYRAMLEAVRAGYDGIEHVNMLFLNFFADHDTDTRTTTRFTLVGDRAATFDLKSKPVVDMTSWTKNIPGWIAASPTLFNPCEAVLPFTRAKASSIFGS